MIRSAKIKFIISMIIFGSIGIFVKNIELPSSAIVQWRTIIGSVFLFLIFLTKKKELI